MNKKLLTLAVASAFAASGSAFAMDNGHGVGATVNGHVFSVFALTNDSNNKDPQVDVNSIQVPAEMSFHTDAELNFMANVAEGVNGRIDLDIGGVSSTNYEGDGIEQAFIDWQAHEMFNLQIGQFNNPLGYEAHDQAELRYFITHGQVRHAFNDAVLDGGSDGNNLQGAAFNLMAGPAKVTLGFLNDIGGAEEENSLLLNISATLLDNLDLSLGTITQDQDTGGFVGNIINFYAAYGLEVGEMPINIWLDYLTAAEEVDSVISVGGSVGFAGGFGVALRYDMTSYAANFDETSITLAAGYAVNDNFDLRFEYRNDEFSNGTSEDGDTIALAAGLRF